MKIGEHGWEVRPVEGTVYIKTPPGWERGGYIDPDYAMQLAIALMQVGRESVTVKIESRDRRLAELEGKLAALEYNEPLSRIGDD